MSYVDVFDRVTDGNWRLPSGEYEGLMHAIETEATRVSFRTRDGAEVLIRVEDILAVVFVSDDAERAIKERLEAERMAGS